MPQFHDFNCLDTMNEILIEARRAWNRWEPLRRRRNRYCRFTFGDQWGDAALSRDGVATTEGELASVGGREPLTNNLIRRLVKSVVGRYRQMHSEKSEISENSELGKLYQANRLDELDARTLEEFLISGVAVHRVSYERRAGIGEGVWVDHVSPDRFFINAVKDPRGFDTELVGCLHDMSLAEVVMRFAGGDRARAKEFSRIYAALQREASASILAGDEEQFLISPTGRCRVVEVWTLECREVLRCHDPLEATYWVAPYGESQGLKRLNAQRRRNSLAQIHTRWDVAPCWQGRFFAPDGTVLWEMSAPASGGCHPFAVKLYPMVNGEVHSLVEDVLPQQKVVNRLINMMDHMLGTAAKGALLFPTQCEVEGMDWDRLARMWAEPGAIIPYTSFGSAEPHQVSTPMADIGARDLLQTEIKLFEDVSGVSSALMGKQMSGVVGADRYEQEVRNATVSILDLMETFSDFVKRRDELLRLFSAR